MKLPFHQNRPRKSDLQEILKVLLLQGPVLLPMERSIQVGTILELLLSRNNIFAAFPVIPKIRILITLPLHRNRPRKSDLQGILKVFLLPGPVLLPMERSIQVRTILELWFRRNNIFAALLSPSSQKFQFVITLLFHQNLDFQGILKVCLVGHPYLPPMEKSIQV